MTDTTFLDKSIFTGGDDELRGGFPFMYNLSVPLGLVLRQFTAIKPKYDSECLGFMCESDYDKATSETRTERKEAKTKQTRKRVVIRAHNTRKK